MIEFNNKPVRYCIKPRCSARSGDFRTPWLAGQDKASGYIHRRPCIRPRNPKLLSRLLSRSIQLPS